MGAVSSALRTSWTWGTCGSVLKLGDSEEVAVTSDDKT